MNTEERLEALPHAVELLAGMQIETEKRLTRLTENVDRMAERATTFQDAPATLADGMAQLTRIAIDHDERIDGLEGKQTQ